MVTTLEEARAEIDKIDRQLVELYEKRMHLMKKVAAYKIANDIPVFDANRETEVIEKNVGFLTDRDLEALYTDFIKLLMDQGKVIQKGIIEAHGNNTE